MKNCFVVKIKIEAVVDDNIVNHKVIQLLLKKKEQLIKYEEDLKNLKTQERKMELEPVKNGNGDSKVP